MSSRQITAVVEWDPETKLFVGIVPGIPGAQTQGASMEELRANLAEVIELCLEEDPSLLHQIPVFIGIQQIEIAQ